MEVRLKIGKIEDQDSLTVDLCSARIRPMSLIERAQEIERRRKPTAENPYNRRFILERIYNYSTELLEAKGTRIDLMRFLSILINESADEPRVEVEFSSRFGQNFIRLEIVGLDERLTIDDTGKVRNSQRQFKAYLTRPSSGFYIREASLKDIEEYSEVMSVVESHEQLSQTNRVHQPEFDVVT